MTLHVTVEHVKAKLEMPTAIGRLLGAFAASAMRTWFVMLALGVVAHTFELPVLLLGYWPTFVVLLGLGPIGAALNTGDHWLELRSVDTSGRVTS